MPSPVYLTLEEVITCYRGEVSEGTLRNWRAMRIGPSFIKIGKAVLYPVGELDRWDKFNLWFADPPDLCRWRNTLRSVDPNRHSWLFKSQAMRYDETYDAESVIRRDVGISSKILHDQELFITTSHAPHIPINDPC